MATMKVPNITMNPWLALLIVGAAGAAIVCWDVARQDPETAPWNAADVPPDNVPILYGTGCMGYAKAPGALDYTPARHRKFPESLAASSASIIGTF